MNAIQMLLFNRATRNRFQPAPRPGGIVPPAPRPMDYYSTRAARPLPFRPRQRYLADDDFVSYAEGGEDTGSGNMGPMPPPAPAPESGGFSDILGKIFSGFGSALGTGVSKYTNLKTAEILAQQKQRTAVATYNAATWNPMGTSSTGTLLTVAAVGLGAYFLLKK